MNERIKELRKSLGLSQEEFGELIGLKKSGVCSIESGTRRVTDKHLKLLQKSDYPINVDWIVTGEGSMFLEGNNDDEIQKYVETILKDDTDSFRRNLIKGLCQLSPEGWKALKQLLETLQKS